MRKILSEKYLRGSGIEIGGLHYPLPVLPGCKVAYVDRMSLAELQATSDVTPVQNEIIVDDAEKLSRFACDSLDFIIANHVLEHCQDVLMTLKIWVSRLRKGGIIYAAVPEKTQTFDRARAVTTFKHIWDEYRRPENNAAEHYREYFSIVDKMSGKDLEDRIAFSVEEKTNIHFHVWDRPAMHELFGKLCSDVGYDVIEGVDHGAEIIWILRKR